MQNAILALILGLVGGGLGAYAVIETRGSGPAEATPAAAPRMDADLLRRIERLEALAPMLEASRADGASLAGRAEGVPDADVAALVPRIEEALLERIQPRIEESVQAKWDTLQAEKEDKTDGQRSRRKRLPLSEVAAEIGLSAGEEADLRQIYKDSEDKMLRLMAGEDGDIEQVRRDIELAAGDRAALPGVMTKYMPKVVQNLGQVMTIETEKQTRILETLGPERAAEYGRFDVVEGNPLGMGGQMRVEARAGD